MKFSDVILVCLAIAVLLAAAAIAISN